MFKNDQNNGFDNSQFDAAMSASGVENVTKKSKGKKAALIGGISAAVVVGGSAAAYGLSDTVKNQVKLRMSKPEKYYAWVTEKNSESLGEILSENYKKRLDNYKKGADIDFSVYYEANDNVKDMIIDEMFGDADSDGTQKISDVIKNINKFSVSGNVKSKSGKVNSNFGIDLDDDRIVSLDAVMDTDAMDYFFRVPELKEKWIGTELSSVEDMIGSESVNMFRDIMKDPASFLSPEELEEEVNKYAGVWSSFVSDVQLEKKEEIDICDISVNYTVATVELNDKDLDKLELEFLKELKKDDIIRGIVVDKLKVVDDEDYEDDIQSEIDDVKEDLDENDYDKDTVIAIDTYIDATGTIRGLGIDVDDEQTYMVIGKDGDSIRGEIKVTDDEGEVPLSVKLTAEENGKKYSGDITINYTEYSYKDDEDVENEAVVKFDDFEIVNEEKCYVNGTVAINIPETDPIDIVLSSDGKEQDVNFTIRADGEDYGNIGIKYSVNYGVDVDIPDKSDAVMVDVEELNDFDFDDYVTSDEISEFIKSRLEKIGFDKEMAERVAESVEDDIYGSGSGSSWDDDDFDFDDDEDFDWDDDEDFDWDDDDEDIIGGSSSADFEFDPDMYKYEDYKDFMTEDEFNEFVDEMKKYYEEYEKKAS
ncbi:DUF6583 family protein [Ruminococcus flavefaciens]|uniref:DUF6583 family protein n=1 Tax=Ruminococcus flavefaciens TaxID=1265 RepID=UPI0026EB2CAA|nr:DUF6583 family protein [Ruminococcus flavefaciens]MDD7515382.1 hypothetical protein [Ruminococcus flavefaciens]MDY5690639.1 DUF6583 family protein [Ruminococcus flavefaciens]